LRRLLPRVPPCRIIVTAISYCIRHISGRGGVMIVQEIMEEGSWRIRFDTAFKK
jgi:hypothetical protein